VVGGRLSEAFENSLLNLPPEIDPFPSRVKNNMETTWTNEDAAEAGRAYQGANDPDWQAPDLDWRYEPAFPVEKLIPLMPSGFNGWNSWLLDERQWDESGGTSRWGDEFTEWWKQQSEDEPVVLVESHDGSKILGIWDGWPRSAVSITSRLPTLPAFVGRARQ